MLNKEQLNNLIDSEGFKWFLEKVEELADDYRLVADNEESDSKKLWLVAKAQGLDEIKTLCNKWTKE